MPLEMIELTSGAFFWPFDAGRGRDADRLGEKVFSECCRRGEGVKLLVPPSANLTGLWLGLPIFPLTNGWSSQAVFPLSIAGNEPPADHCFMLKTDVDNNASRKVNKIGISKRKYMTK